MLQHENTTTDCLRAAALRFYRFATAGQRARTSRRLQATGNCPVAILFYHRVAHECDTKLTISTANFAAHLDWLKSRFDVVSLEEAQTRIRSNYNDRPTVSITFDDGYSSNCSTAIPELLRRDLTATYFVSTDFIESGAPFPHDAKIENAPQPNTVDELRDMVSAGIELGAHTRSHCNLGAITCPEQMRHEIAGSADQLAQWCNLPIKYFSFPFGLPANTNQLAVDIIRETGFAGFCTAYGAWNWPNNDAYHLRRIHGDVGLERLKNWLTLDSRKLVDKQVLPFAVENAPSESLAVC